MTDFTEEQPRRAARFWEQRTKFAGMIQNGEELHDACLQYFEWVDDNPLLEDKIFSTSMGLERDTQAKMRAMTVRGLCLFLGISHTFWYEHWLKDDRFKHVCKWAEDVITQQKVEGAAAGLLNASFIGKEIGLIDKAENTVKGDPNAPIEMKTSHTLDLNNLTEDQLAAIATIRIAR